MNIKSLLFTALAVIGLSQTSHAQAKIAHINSAELLEGLPQLDSINTQLDALTKQYQDMLKAIETELTNKAEYNEQNPATTDAIKKLRASEYEQMVGQYQALQQEAQQALTKKQAELMQPLIEEVKKVVQDVAKSKGYTYVFDSSDGGGMIYGDPAHDLMDAVKQKLNIQ